ncbi:helix-turn-helix transcriptional regulator [Leucobacter sp. HY1910]
MCSKIVVDVPAVDRPGEVAVPAVQTVPMAPVMPAVFSAAEAARYCGRAPGTFANWRALGKGPRYMRDGARGSRIYYLRIDLDAWLKRQLHGGDA